ncbi:MAG: GntR family transcriptional regulator [Chloroflexi bacterium]|nr:GntR family transcriptional regulator [Chloroflexota bacterium]
MKPINRESPVPAYYQIAVDLHDRILNNEWKTGDQIPPEEELAKHYEVSRVTMRQALAELVKDGVLVRQRGSGTFVSQRPMPLIHDLSLPTSFSGKLRRQGFALSSQVLAAETFLEPFDWVMQHLRMGSSDPVAYLKRLLLINGQPTAIDRSWFSERLCPGITEQPLIENSLSMTLAQRYGLVPVRSEIGLEVVRATEKDATLLRTFVDTPMVLLTAVLYLEDGVPLEYSMTTWLGDRVRFNLSSNPDSGATADAPFVISLKSKT